jgi:DNA repair protein RecO (recombination protein O)
MEWTGEGVVLSARPHGENAAILDVLTAQTGRDAGIVRGGTGRRLAPALQPGAQVHLHWRARLGEHLGQFKVEPLRNRSSTLLHRPERLAALASVCALAAFALPEREPQPLLFPATEAMLDGLVGAGEWFGAYLGWECLLLAQCGFGLDLGTCAVSGAREGLAYVSPRTGRAVTAAAAGDWAERLLPLPALMGGAGGGDIRAQMAAGLAVTGHFLIHVLAPALGNRPLPEARARLVHRFAPEAR